MSLPLMRLLRTFPLIVSACCLSLPLTQSGCEGDVDAADKQARDYVSEGRQKTEPGISAAPGVPDAYKKAAGVTSASPAAKVEALSNLAEAERDRAVALMTEADRLDSDLLRLIGATNRQSIRIKANNSLIAGLSAMEPTKATQAIDAQRKAAQGDEKPVWVEHETGSLQAMKGLEEQAKQLQEQIAQLESQSKELTGQRGKLIADAEQIEKQSAQAQGQQSAELFNQSVDARKQAADLSVQAEAVEAKLMPLRQDLERVQANQQALAKTIEAFGNQLQATQENWTKVQGHITELKTLNRRILDGAGGNEPTGAAAPARSSPQPEAEAAPAGGDAGGAPKPAAPAQLAPSIVGKLRQINDVVTQIEQRRGEAESLLKSAIGHTDDAGKAAASLVSSLSTQMNAGGGQRPERAAWKNLSDLHNPSAFKLRQASLQILLADLYRARAADLATRANMAQLLASALQPAQLPVPQEAGGANLQSEADAVRTASVGLYGDAEKGLQDVVQAPKSNELMSDAAKAAHLMQLVRLYSQAQADPQTAANLAARARSLAATGEEVSLPAASLPNFVQDALDLRAPATPTTGPATRPGTGTPATPPTGGGGAAPPTGTASPSATTPPAPTTPPDPAAPPVAPDANPAGKAQ